MFLFLFVQRVTLSWTYQDCPITAHSAANPFSPLSLHYLNQITASVWVMEKDLLISLTLHSEKRIYKPAVPEWMREESSVILVYSRCRYRRGAAQGVTVTRLSDSTCGWGMNDLQYSVWNVFAMLKQFSVSCNSRINERQKSQNTCFGSTVIMNNWVN